MKSRSQISMKINRFICFSLSYHMHKAIKIKKKICKKLQLQMDTKKCKKFMGKNM